MARIPEIERRLQRWGEYKRVGDGSGYPAVNVLHPGWSAPASTGLRPPPKAYRASDVRETGVLVESLPNRRRAVVKVHYVHRWPMALQALVLGCAERTVHARIEAAHREIARRLDSCNKQETG